MHKRFGKEKNVMGLLGRIALLVPLLVSLVFVLSLPVSAADVPITWGNQLPIGTLYVTDTFTLDVTMGAVTNFDAGQFCITYNKDVLRIDSVSNGSLGGGTGAVRVVNAVKVVDGTWVVVVDTPDASGVTGSGTLCTVHFTAMGVGLSPLAFADLPINPGPPPSGGLGSRMINDNTGATITATWGTLGVTVEQLPGDINGDGTVNDTDILGLGRMIVQLDATKAIADVNADGKINCADITKIERIIRGLP